MQVGGMAEEPVAPHTGCSSLCTSSQSFLNVSDKQNSL